MDSQDAESSLGSMSYPRLDETFSYTDYNFARDSSKQRLGNNQLTDLQLPPLQEDLYHGLSQSTSASSVTQHYPENVYDFEQFHVDASAVRNIDIGTIVRPLNEQPYQAGQSRALPAPHWNTPQTSFHNGRALSDPVPGHGTIDEILSTAGSEAPDSGVCFHPASAYSSTIIHYPGTQDVIKQEYAKPMGKHMVRSASTRTGVQRSRGSGLPSTARRRSSQHIGTCPECSKELKSQSDYTKHMKTHIKPHKCREPTCAKHIEGFSTPNDCDRHERSKHKKQTGDGKDKGYICQACPVPTAGAKWWPRLDNFKSHITKKHADRDVQELVRSSQRDRRPDDDVMSMTQSNCFSTSQVDETQYQQDFMQPYSTPMTSALASSQQGESFSWLENPDHSIKYHELLGLGHSQCSDTYNLLDRKHHTISHGTDEVPEREFSGALVDATAATASSRPIVEQEASMIMNDDIANLISYSTEQNQVAYDLVEIDNAGTKPNRRRNSKGDVVVYDKRKGGVTEKRFSCKYKRCNSTFKRECDRRKHEHRHTRPYGCTWPKCYEQHGSKSDWLRHERHLHMLPETWRCNFLVEDNECGEFFWERRYFRSHILTHHLPNGDLTGELSEDRMEDMQLGRRGALRYWCGFCKKVIENPSCDKVDPWDARGEHIGRHYDSKSGCNIRDWVCVEFRKTKSELMAELKRTGVHPEREHERLPTPEPVLGDDLGNWEKDLLDHIVLPRPSTMDETNGAISVVQ